MAVASEERLGVLCDEVATLKADMHQVLRILQAQASPGEGKGLRILEAVGEAHSPVTR